MNITPSYLRLYENARQQYFADPTLQTGEALQNIIDEWLSKDPTEAKAKLAQEITITNTSNPASDKLKAAQGKLHNLILNRLNLIPKSDSLIETIKSLKPSELASFASSSTIHRDAVNKFYEGKIEDLVKFFIKDHRALINFFKSPKNEGRKEELAKFLERSGMPIPVEIKVELSKICGEHLKVLDLRLPKISKEQLSELVTKCPNVNSIDFWGCEGMTEEVLQELNRLTLLKEINLSRTDINDNGLKTLGDGPLTRRVFERLDLSDCKKITKEGLNKALTHAAYLEVTLPNKLNISEEDLKNLTSDHPGVTINLGLKSYKNGEIE